MLDETHDPALQSWVASANLPDCAFPIQNLPLGVFRAPGDPQNRLGVAIGEAILDLRDWLPGSNLNGYLALPAPQRRDLRLALSRALRMGSPRRELLLRSNCQMLLPAQIGDYTDFYASLDHAANVGRLFRPENPLLPNYQHLPVAYHGRSSSIVISGTSVHRPHGQLAAGEFGPTRELDYEVEIGAFLGPGNSLGEPIPITQAEQHVAGICLLNDWSARDIQRWEYQPLGPFLSKSFATSISPWMVTFEALEPFRVPSSQHEVPLLPYLQTENLGAFDVTLEVYVKTPALSEPFLLSRSNFRDLYWTLAQMVTHHASNGCPLRPGDLIGSGTISGPEKTNRGCLLELTSKGAEPIVLPSGEQRVFLEDGDRIEITGYCHRPGYASIGLGRCTAEIQAVLSVTSPFHSPHRARPTQ